MFQQPNNSKLVIARIIKMPTLPQSPKVVMLRNEFSEESRTKNSSQKPSNETSRVTSKLNKLDEGSYK